MPAQFPVKILIIDDLEDNRTLLRLDLEDEIDQILVDEASCGEEGLQKIRNGDFHVVICDLMLPGMDGFEVLSRSREENGDNEIPFIFLSANKQKDAAEKALQAGAIDFLTKPYELPELINKVVNLARISHLNKSLIDARKNLTEKNRLLKKLNKEKDEVLRIVSHDMRNPLSNILGFASLLRTDGFEDTGELEHIAGMIETSSENLLHLVNSLLDVARVESGHIKIKRTRLAVNRAIRDCVLHFELLAHRKRICLEFDLEDREITAWLDGPKMDQVLSNLLSNAIKFTPDGGKVTVSSRLTGMDEESGQPFFDISVSDTGVGIPGEHLDKIFDKFGIFQREGTNKEKGSGLGLSIVKRFVELQDGEITVRSEPGKGTTFTIRFRQNTPEFIND